MRCVDRPLLLTCILVLFPGGKKLEATSRILDLGFLVVKRFITRKRRSPELRHMKHGYDHWLSGQERSALLSGTKTCWDYTSVPSHHKGS
ncbi:hypothetical protein NDU88_005197 [Pleurodeles waltl]|uniref:Uncharacterized protein n=1 Tax=Pleurodeles waltl TaxID=8319 RepID=A0AAV7N0I5_PLEWA|nr:hypothetical protein NDU88_005197 [Pleurodeles waltl]